MIGPMKKEGGGTIRQALSTLRSRERRYRRVAGLIIMDSLWRFRGNVARVMVVSGLSLALMAGALGLLLTYGRLLENNEDVVIFGFTAQPSSSYLLLISAMLAGGAMYFASSFFQLHAERGFLDLARRYGVCCAERIVTLVSASLHGQGQDNAIPDQTKIRKLTIGDSQICARVLVGILGTLPAVAGFAVYSGFLLYLDMTITLIVFGVMSVSSLFFYSLSVNAANLMRQREGRKQALSQKFTALMDFMKGAANPLTSDHRLLKSTVETGFNVYFLEFFRARSVASQGAHVSTATQAIAIIIIGVVKGSEIISTGTGFGELAIYLVAGRLAMSSFLTVTRSLVMINRFYPTASSYFDEVEKLRKSGDNGQVPVGTSQLKPLELVAGALSKSPSDEPSEISPGGRLALVTPKPVDRFALPAILSAFRWGEGEGGNALVPPGCCWLVPETPTPAAVSFNESVGLAPETKGDRLRADLAALGLPPETLSTLPNDPNAVMNQDKWNQLDLAVYFAAHLLSAGRSTRPLVVVSADALALIGEVATRNILDQFLHDRIVLISYSPKTASATGALGENLALLFNGETLHGYLTTDELRSNPDIVQQLGVKPKGATTAIQIPDDDDDI